MAENSLFRINQPTVGNLIGVLQNYDPNTPLFLVDNETNQRVLAFNVRLIGNDVWVWPTKFSGMGAYAPLETMG